MLTTCRRLGVPVAPAKCAGPTSVLTFLGFELDTNCMVVRLPQEKLPGPSEGVDGKKGLQEERTGVTAGPLATCSHSYSARPHVRSSVD